MKFFYVTAHWDDDAEVYYSKSNIIGLHVVANDLDEFVDVVLSTAPELCMINHSLKSEDSVRKLWVSGFIYRLRQLLKNAYYLPVILLRATESNQVQA